MKGYNFAWVQAVCAICRKPLKVPAARDCDSEIRRKLSRMIRCVECTRAGRNHPEPVQVRLPYADP